PVIVFLGIFGAAWAIRRRRAAATKKAAIPGWIAAVSCVRWLLASGAGRAAAQSVVAAEDDRSALCDLEVRGCGGQGVKRDRPVVASASPTSNLLWRGSWGGRHRCG